MIAISGGLPASEIYKMERRLPKAARQGADRAGLAGDGQYTLSRNVRVST